MSSSIRALFFAVAMLLCCVPATSSVGGGGESGIWILPSYQPVGLFSVFSSGQVQSSRATYDLPVVASGVYLVVPPEMGVPLAVVQERLTQLQLPAYTYGNRVFLPLFTLAAIRDSSSGQASGTIIDSNGLGYVLSISRLGTSGVRLQVF